MYFDAFLKTDTLYTLTHSDHKLMKKNQQEEKTKNNEIMPTRMNFLLCHLTFILSIDVNQTIECQNFLRTADLHYDCKRVGK